MSCATKLTMALSCVVIILVAPAPAHAWHNDEVKITEDTAHTLRDGEVRLGLWKVGYGLWEFLDIETYIFPWFLRVPNLAAKWEIWNNESWAISARAGLFWMNLKNLASDTSDATIWSVPFELALSLRFADDFTWSLTSVFTKVALTGSYNDDDFEGTAAVTNLQLTTSFEYRVDDVVALVLTTRYLAYQEASANTQIVYQPDEFTTVEVIGAASTDIVDVQHATSVALSAVFSWDVFNLRIGGGFGNYSIPGLNFVIPELIAFPELDLYWRW